MTTINSLSIDPLKQVQIGKSNLSITQMGFGAGALGDAWQAISEKQAGDSLSTAYEEGLRYFDTAPWYGNTLSEHRVGHFLRQKNKSDYVLSTKVGRVYMRDRLDEGREFYQRWQGGLKFKLRFDYTQAGIIRSYEDSLMRMGIGEVDSLVIHDLDYRHQIDDEGVARAFGQLDAGGGFAELKKLKDSGEIKVIGAGINHIGMIPRFVEHFDIDYFLLAMPYTLIDQSALDIELPLCEEKGIGIVIGAIFGSGILATGTKAAGLKYGYKDAEPDMIAKVQKMEEVCEQFNVELAAAALQFPLAHPAVNAVIPGCNSREQVLVNIRHLRANIPDEFWSTLKDKNLIRSDAPIPGE